MSCSNSTTVTAKLSDHSSKYKKIIVTCEFYMETITFVLCLDLWSRSLNLLFHQGCTSNKWMIDHWLCAFLSECWKSTSCHLEMLNAWSAQLCRGLLYSGHGGCYFGPGLSFRQKHDLNWAPTIAATPCIHWARTLNMFIMIVYLT